MATDEATGQHHGDGTEATSQLASVARATGTTCTDARQSCALKPWRVRCLVRVGRHSGIGAECCFAIRGQRVPPNSAVPGPPQKDGLIRASPQGPIGTPESQMNRHPANR